MGERVPTASNSPESHGALSPKTSRAPAHRRRNEEDLPMVTGKALRRRNDQWCHGDNRIPWIPQDHLPIPCFNWLLDQVHNKNHPPFPFAPLPFFKKTRSKARNSPAVSVKTCQPQSKVCSLLSFSVAGIYAKFPRLRWQCCWRLAAAPATPPDKDGARPSEASNDLLVWVTS